LKLLGVLDATLLVAQHRASRRFLRSKIADKNTSTNGAVTSGSFSQVDDVLNGLVSLVIGGFHFAVGPFSGSGL
jgi:hypothetical protein